MPNLWANIPQRGSTYGAADNRAQTGLALNAAYVPGTSGPAVAFRFTAPATTTLATVDFFVQAISGGSTDHSHLVELRTAASATLPTTGSTIATQAGVALGCAAGTWQRATLNGAVTASEEYWVCIGNDGINPTIDFSTVTYLGGPRDIDATLMGAHQGITTANGWGSSTPGTGIVPMVLTFADGSVIGSCYTTVATGFTNNQLERGLRWATGPDEDLTLVGVAFQAGTAVNALRVYEGSTAPLGAALVTATPNARAAEVGMIRCAPTRLRKGVPLRVVLDTGSNSTLPGVYQMQDPNCANRVGITKAAFAGDALNNWFATEDNGAGGWTDFNTTSLVYAPRLQLLAHRHHASALKLIGPGGGLIG